MTHDGSGERNHEAQRAEQANSHWDNGIRGFLRRLWEFLRRLALRFQQDRGPQLAAGLSYASLLALVPLFAISLALLTAFPAFESAQVQLKTFIFDALPPNQAMRAAEELDRLLSNVSRLTGPGILGLSVTALLLLSNIHASLNAIWRVREPRPLSLQLLVYWALLTLGPLLFGASISVSSVAFAPIQEFLGLGGEFSRVASRLLALILAITGFSVLYLVVPNRPVSISSALTGGIVAGVGFETLKFGFGLYISNFPSYEVVYGALSTLPILLLWIYLVWIVILIGAEVAAALPEWRAARLRGFEDCGPMDRLPLALALLHRLSIAQLEEGPLRRFELTVDLPMPPGEVDIVLDQLRRCGLVDTTAGARWLLARDLSTFTLRDLLEALELALEQGRHWPDPVPAMLAQVRTGVTGQLDVTLDRLVRPGQVAPLAETLSAPDNEGEGSEPLRRLPLVP